MGFISNILQSRKKILLSGIFIILIILIFVWPFVVGIILESKLNKGLAAFKEKLPKKIDLAYKVDRSYLSTKINLEFRIIAKDGQGSVFADSTFHHYSLTALSKLTVDREFQVTYLNRLEKMPDIEIQTDIGLTGTIKNKMKIDSFKLLKQDAKEFAFEIEGLSSRVFFNKDFSIELIDLNVARIKSENVDKKIKHEVTNTSFMFDMNKKTNIFDAFLEINFDKYTSLTSTYGPGILEFEAKRISTEVLDGIVKLFDDFRKYATAGDDSTSDDFKTKLLGRTMTILPSLIKSTPRLEIKSLKLKTEKGDLIGQGHFSIPKSDGGIFSLLSNLDLMVEIKSPESFLIDTFATISLIKKKQLNTSPEDLAKISETVKKSKIKNPADLLKTMNEKNQKEVVITAKDEEDARKEAITSLQSIYVSKYLIKTGEEVKFKFEYKDGNMKLNSEPFSFPFKK
ncbi:MAG: DUF945 family protein [Oligoflexia bacterium]|nr:DUF945 family protein [Oligoflexia bacterium]